MGEMEHELVAQVIERTESEIVLFFIIVAVALVAFLLPLYAMIIKEKREKSKADSERQERYIQREAHIIQVITQNSDVIAGLKSMLETFSAATNASLTRMDGRINDNNNLNQSVLAEIKVMHAQMAGVNENQSRMMNKLQQLLVKQPTGNRQRKQKGAGADKKDKEQENEDEYDEKSLY